MKQQGSSGTTIGCESMSQCSELDDSDPQLSITPPPSSISLSCSECNCNSCEIQAELNLLRENSDQVLNDAYNEINTSETELAKYLQEIRDLEDELQKSFQEEKELLEKIQLENKLFSEESYSEECHDEEKQHLSDQDLALDLQRRDGQIIEMEKELEENTKLIRYLSLSLT
jgi:hypothetical protein